MRLSLYAFVRMLGLPALILTISAITLSRLVPENAMAATSIEPRHAKPGWVGCNAIPRGRPMGKALLIDPEKERIRTVRLPRGESLDQATGSPWIGDDGRGEVVGRWVKVGRDLWTGAKRIEDGLARYSLPDGKPLDRIATDLMPFSPPSWSPDGRRLVIYPSGDGRLYRVEFPARADDPDSRAAEPTALSWRCPRPGDGCVRILDAIWTDEPSLSGLVLASIVIQRKVGDGKARNQPARLWWLRLDPDARAIVAAGPMTGSPTEGAERFPRPVRDPSGRLLLAFLVADRENEAARLTVAPLRVDPAEAGAIVVESEARTLAEGCLLEAPAPASDGCSIAVVSRDVAGHARQPRLVTLELTRSH
jgi:hypothetical protein